MQNALLNIAMATYNGEKYLKEQLDSIYSQSYQNIQIIACDDCSTDGTVDILKVYSQKNGLKFIVNKKRSGFVKTFENAVHLCEGDYIAFSDQDDVWLPNKLEIQMNYMVEFEKQYPDKPLLIHHDVYIVDEMLTNKNIRFLKTFGHISGLKNMLFGNAKVQGATVLFNKKLKEISFPLPENLAFHDLFLSYICEVFGKRIYINEPYLLYRQHSNNQIGIQNKSKLEKTRSFFNRKVIIFPEKEADTLMLFNDRFQNALNDSEKIMIHEYFNIYNLKISLYHKVLIIIKNRFNSHGSIFKLIIKIIRLSIK